MLAEDEKVGVAADNVVGAYSFRQRKQVEVFGVADGRRGLVNELDVVAIGTDDA